MKTEQITKQSTLIAVVRIRGKVSIREEIQRTLKMMKLHKKNWCVVLRNTPENIGMMQKVKDYCTFGEVDSKTVSILLEKRGRLSGNKLLTGEYVMKYMKVNLSDFVTKLTDGTVKIRDIPGVKPYFKLKPPVGGFERGGIKRSFSIGGVLGYRGKNINNLIGKMI